MLRLSATQVRNERVAAFSSSVTGWTIAAPSGIGAARRTVVQDDGGSGLGLECVAQLVRRDKLTNSAALRINMDRPFDDGLDAAGGLAGVINAGLALVGLYLGVIHRQRPELGERGDFDFLAGGLSLEPINTPRLDPGQSEGQREGCEQGAGHSPTPFRMA